MNTMSVYINLQINAAIKPLESACIFKIFSLWLFPFFSSLYGLKTSEGLVNSTYAQSPYNTVSHTEQIM